MIYAIYHQLSTCLNVSKLSMRVTIYIQQLQTAQPDVYFSASAHSQNLLIKQPIKTSSFKSQDWPIHRKERTVNCKNLLGNNLEIFINILEIVYNFLTYKFYFWEFILKKQINMWKNLCLSLCDFYQCSWYAPACDFLIR